MSSEKENNLPDKLIYTKEVIEFVTVANEYCVLLESLETLTREQFIEETYKILTLLHLKALTLPKPKDISNVETETFMNEADWHFIDTGISTKLGSLETFNDLREPIIPDNPVNISISECLTDTYQDLKDFTQLYQIGNEDAVTEGLWECKNNFEQIWGPRIIIVMKEFHNLIYGDNDLSEEEKTSQKLNPKGENWIDDIFEN
ncbi:MAG: DUF5063 domain-containing protein [Bacteroidales bacterium]|nr:DUF5063 domain-containing protein [Bacteroidales bacterium]